MKFLPCWTVAALLVSPCIAAAQDRTAAGPPAGGDPHSFANPGELRVEHLDLYLDVDFANQRLSAVADLRVEHRRDTARVLVLDTRDLIVRDVWLVRAPQDLVTLEWSLAAPVGTLGRALRIALPAADVGSTSTVRISYQTRPEASGLQWLAPAQTAGGNDPFLFSQSQAIHARSWIPIQDTPEVRLTYTAEVKVPAGLRAVMSAEGDPAPSADGRHRFRTTQPVPSYLIAIAVGRLEHRPLGPRTAIYAEPSVIEAAANEFVDTERMIEVAERLFGPYRWARYDLLILPPAFPYGGMENPLLSFISPTVIAGDRSLVSLIAHELAHSWSGNLVTNATWRDFWLNEGFTVFLERRILDALYGERRRDMEDVLGLQSLQRDLRRLAPRDQVLAIDLRGRDPDDGFSVVPYEKGRLFLGWLESRMGREALTAFLRGYFDHFAFRSITTEQFRDYLLANLGPGDRARVTVAELDEWLYRPGLPATAVLPHSDAFTRVDEARVAWLAGRVLATALPTGEWTTHEWLHFLDNMPSRLPAVKLSELDGALALTGARNAEIAHSWLLIAVRNDYRNAFPRLAEYLATIGRRKLILPLYAELMKTPAGRRFARDVYMKARPGYHPITVASIDPIVLGNR